MTCSPRLTQLMLSMWDASPLKRPTATFVLSELESIGSNWDTLGIFSHVQVAANMSGKELIEALGMASRASLNFDNHSKKVASSSRDFGSIGRAIIDGPTCDAILQGSVGGQEYAARHPERGQLLQLTKKMKRCQTCVLHCVLPLPLMPKVMILMKASKPHQGN